MMRIVVLLPLLLSAMQAEAHQQKEAVTRVLFNQRTGNIEVMHRFLLHDAEHAVKRLRSGDADMLGSESDRAYFAGYVNQHFVMSHQRESMELSPVGQEIEGRFIWIYAETPVPAGVESLTVMQSALLELWPGQINLVNVERDGIVRSATFRKGSRAITIELP